MSNELTCVQKEQIDNLLRSDEPTPAEETIGDGIRKVLGISDQEYQELEDTIEAHIQSYYQRIIG